MQQQQLDLGQSTHYLPSPSLALENDVGRFYMNNLVCRCRWRPHYPRIRGAICLPRDWLEIPIFSPNWSHILGPWLAKRSRSQRSYIIGSPLCGSTKCDQSRGSNVYSIYRIYVCMPSRRYLSRQGDIEIHRRVKHANAEYLSIDHKW
jgi:hypothetical protein